MHHYGETFRAAGWHQFIDVERAMADQLAIALHMAGVSFASTSEPEGKRRFYLSDNALPHAESFLRRWELSRGAGLAQLPHLTVDELKVLEQAIGAAVGNWRSIRDLSQTRIRDLATHHLTVLTSLATAAAEARYSLER